MALNIWKLTPERAAVRLVRTILRDSPSPLTTKEIFEEAVRREANREYPHPPTVVVGASAQQPAKLENKRGVVHTPPPPPPHPENAIRSVRYVCTYTSRYVLFIACLETDVLGCPRSFQVPQNRYSSTHAGQHPRNRKIPRRSNPLRRGDATPLGHDEQIRSKG